MTCVYAPVRTSVCVNTNFPAVNVPAGVTTVSIAVTAPVLLKVEVEGDPPVQVCAKLVFQVVLVVAGSGTTILLGVVVQVVNTLPLI